MYYWLPRYILHFNEVRSKIRIQLGARRWGPLANQNLFRCAEVCRSASCRFTQTRSTYTISTQIRWKLTKSAQTKCVTVVIFAIQTEACMKDFKAGLWQSWYLLISFINISKQRKIKLRCRPNVPLPDYKRTELIQACLLAISMKYVKIHTN